MNEYIKPQPPFTPYQKNLTSRTQSDT